MAQFSELEQRYGHKMSAQAISECSSTYEENDFLPYLEELHQTSEQELHKQWRVFTNMKEALEKGRRLENASWRLWFKSRIQQTPGSDDSELSKFEKSLGEATEMTSSVIDTIFEGEKEDDSSSDDAKSEIEELCQKHNWSKESIADLKEYLGSKLGVTDHKPKSRSKQLAGAAFSHSLERNGANNFLLYVIRATCEEFRFTLYSPADGPMRHDFESLNIPVHIVNAKVDYNSQLEKILPQYDFLFANTIMNSEPILMANKLSMPSVWVIHEAWPQDQFDYYAKEVFQMSHIDGDLIKSAFTSTNAQIIYPAETQKRCYDGLVPPSRAHVIYNGIPLTSINAYRASMNRAEVRKELGYGPGDCVVLHIGTICARKAQQATTGAFIKMCQNEEELLGNPKLLMVGARYIRDHEITYLNEIKEMISTAGIEDKVQILDIQKNVLRFYLAADIVVCPSINEVLPLVICEGMAFERPLIASDIDGIPEAITNDVEGLLIPPGDVDALATALARLSEDSELRSQMGKAGRKRVLNQFSFKGFINKYRKIFQSFEEQAEEQRSRGRSSMLLDDLLAGTTILVDMDNTLVDFDGAFKKLWLEKHPEDEALIDFRQQFELESNFPKEKQQAVLDTMATAGLFYGMEPFEGSVEAVKHMAKMGAEVMLVTSPLVHNTGQCVMEKYQWVTEHLGPEWTSKVMITRDKSVVKGAVLIDDKPVVSGANPTPEWTHILFNQPYNAVQTKQPRLNSWKEWKSVLAATLCSSSHQVPHAA